MALSYATVEDLYQAILKRLAEPGYKNKYVDEAAFEEDVWTRVREVVGSQHAPQHCLTSHAGRKDRSASAWKTFCKGNWLAGLRYGDAARADATIG